MPYLPHVFICKKTPLCFFCKHEKETVIHLLFLCPEIMEMWQELKVFIKNGYRVETENLCRECLTVIFNKISKNGRNVANFCRGECYVRSTRPTSGATPANLLMAGIAVSYLQNASAKVEVGLDSSGQSPRQKTNELHGLRLVSLLPDVNFTRYPSNLT